MAKRIDWESQIGRRLKLRDLHVFFTAVQRGSMAKAAQQLGVSQPAVSEIIADLENALGVRLLDRHPQGVEPTKYGDALIKRSTVVFDELKQSVRDIDFLADPTAGEVTFGCPEWMAAILSPVIERFARQNPRVLLRTNVCDDKSVFPPRIPTLAPDVPGWLGAQGVRLIGLDLPSVDQVDSETLPIHHALGAANVIILENLDLRKVGPGTYELIVFPLRITGADGSPVRAVLVERG